MKINYLLGIFVILIVVIFGCTLGQIQNDSPIKPNENINKESMEKMNEGFMMKNSHMVIVDEKENEKGMMIKEVVLDNGAKIMANGQIIYKNGTTMMLHENESIWMDGSFMKAGEMMKGEMMESSYKSKILAGTTSPYLEFNKEDYDKALKENKKILLYFYASWCPLCKKEQPETMAAFNELKDPNLVGFRVHYNDGEDNNDAKALAQQFQVPYQHTKVIIKDGKQVLKAPDSWDRQRYLTELSKI